ncbi:pyridoxamine 5'-phosphate oxidase family protein [Actinopolymorpha rutila]|uniref:Nitroimidazol reductase NimA-like FMN-containing flavoprotein (Pyridoxamine 5'-phosphate oxidase superfamily) n=1 Tax=Actinopolymorpha rutila TaxID=446787 RepID=A0A852ZLZ3_9ACTN|nr:pyridoxamine 5'-phosphate oxidase family protein [Actinopolymorpha rutila]NYH93273.1 nitroimidazol reductase NimA-like FMN-containing flavoprotein (pyridoxamine 5'-phosphate oxidase superfamily) [Actinopolymorpha rutila]
MYDAYGLEVLDQSECLELLRQNKVGRFVFVDRLLLAVHPVAYVFDQGSIVFQTNGGAKLDAATKHDLAAFEVDYIDPDLGWGWTVTLSGHAEPVTDSYEVARLHERLPEPWTNSGRVDVIRMHGEIIQGRRKKPDQVDPSHLMPDNSGQAVHGDSPDRRHQAEGEHAKTQGSAPIQS